MFHLFTSMNITRDPSIHAFIYAYLTKLAVQCNYGNLNGIYRESLIFQCTISLAIGQSSNVLLARKACYTGRVKGLP